MLVTPFQPMSRSWVLLGLWVWHRRRRRSWSCVWVSEGQVEGGGWVALCLPSLPRARIPVQ